MSEDFPDNPDLADELLIVRHSGEIPEVALHGSLWHLTGSPDGPGRELVEVEVLALKGMVVERYREMILRDLEPANRNKSFYRGVARAAVNWHRLEKFCRREGLELELLRAEIGAALVALLCLELAEVAAGRPVPALNCFGEELWRFAVAVEVNPATLPTGWEHLCQPNPD